MSRETRRLLSAAALALLTLWLLARVRFPDSSAAPNPVPPLLAQLAPPARFAELASELTAVGGRVRDALSVVSLPDDDGRTMHVALRVRPSVAATIAHVTNPAGLAVSAAALAADRPSGLVLVATGRRDPVSLPRPWRPARPDAAEFLFAAMPASSDAIAVQPVLLSAWTSVPSAAWQANVWRLPADTALPPGSFLFTAAGELAGTVARDADALILVPASSFYQAVDTLSGGPSLADAGWVGIGVTSLTGRVAAATDIPRGVMVTEVDPRSPAKGLLGPGAVVTAVNGVVIGSIAEWSAIIDRLRIGDGVRVHAEGDGEAGDVDITAIGFPSTPWRLGARLRRISGRTEIVDVEAASAAADAGLRPGDIVTRAGTVDNPTPAELTKAFAASPNTPLLLLFARSGTTHATALER